MTIQTKPERRRRAVIPLDDQQTREYSLLALIICFSNDVALFSHEVRVNVIHRCWGDFIARLSKRGVQTNWHSPHPNTGRWRALDETIESLVDGGSLRLSMPVGRGRIILNLEDGGKKVFKAASKKIFKAVEKDFREFVKDYFIA